MKRALGSTPARVLPFLAGATRRKAPYWSDKAKRRQGSQPVKPLPRIEDTGKDPEFRTDRHILTVDVIFDQGCDAYEMRKVYDFPSSWLSPAFDD